MTELSTRHCRRPEKSDSPLPVEQSRTLLKQLHDGWSIDHDDKHLQRTFQFKDFYETVAFINAVAWIANHEDHHPDLQASYKRCTVDYTTHAIGGLSENDFICAARIDTLLP